MLCTSWLWCWPSPGYTGTCSTRFWGILATSQHCTLPFFERHAAPVGSQRCHTGPAEACRAPAPSSASSCSPTSFHWPHPKSLPLPPRPYASSAHPSSMPLRKPPSHRTAAPRSPAASPPSPPPAPPAAGFARSRPPSRPRDPAPSQPSELPPPWLPEGRSSSIEDISDERPPAPPAPWTGGWPGGGRYGARGWYGCATAGEPPAVDGREETAEPGRSGGVGGGWGWRLARLAAARW